MKATITTAAAVLAALALATPAAAVHGDTGTHEVGHYLGAMATFGGGGGDDGGVRGIVELEGRPDGRSRVRGILIGLLLPAVSDLRPALSDRPCAAVSSGGDYSFIGGVAIRGDARGVALMEEEGIYYFFRALRHARSLAFVAGEPDKPIIVGCAALEKHAIDPVPDARDSVLATAARLTEGPSVLGYMLADADGPAAGAAALARLQPGEEYDLLLSRQSCEEATADRGLSIASPAADDLGNAYLDIALAPLSAALLHGTQSLLVTRGEAADGLIIVVCADARAAGARPLR